MKVLIDNGHGENTPGKRSGRKIERVGLYKRNCRYGYFRLT
jgi:hypothetical protein